MMCFQEAALDHYFYHDNTAPFIAYRLIQRFTTSNPSPRYVKAVATAFRAGSYENIGSGWVSCFLSHSSLTLTNLIHLSFPFRQYGDLAATIAAVLLDSEAASVNLDANPFKVMTGFCPLSFLNLISIFPKFALPIQLPNLPNSSRVVFASPSFASWLYFEAWRFKLLPATPLFGYVI